VNPNEGDATATPAAVPTSTTTPIVAASHFLFLVRSTRKALSSPSIAPGTAKGRSIMALLFLIV
jgi:hypothetical protein